MDWTLQVSSTPPLVELENSGGICRLVGGGVMRIVWSGSRTTLVEEACGSSLSPSSVVWSPMLSPSSSTFESREIAERR